MRRGWHRRHGRLGRLGKTARGGPRSGAIAVDPVDVESRVEALLEKFAPCSGTKLTPAGDAAARPVNVPDAATGVPRRVRVLLRPTPKPPGVIGGGRLETSVDSRGEDLRQDVVLTMNSNACAPHYIWREVMEDVLHHELAHAADPAIVLTATGRRRHVPQVIGSCSYYNSPEEMTAQVAEVERQLRRLPVLTRARTRPEELLEKAPKFDVMRRCLTPANRRRFLKLAARIHDDARDRVRPADLARPRRRR